MPAQNIVNIPPEMSLVDLVFQVLITWGRNEIVVSVPAAMPSSVTVSTLHILPRRGVASPDSCQTLFE
jgi:hypothetical protein